MCSSDLHGIQFGFSFQFGRRLLDFFVTVRRAQRAQAAHMRLDCFGIRRRLSQPGIRRHIGFRNHITRIIQMQAMSFIAVTPAHTGQIGSRAFAAPEEGAVINELARH